MGSTRSDRSVVSIVGACRLDLSCASGTVPFASGFFGVHCFAPAGLVVSSHSYLNRFSRNPLSHLIGLLVHAPSRPLVIAWGPLPLPCLFFQPRPCSSMGAPSGSGPTCSPAGAAPWVLPTVWPPTMSATVSLSLIHIS